MHAQVFSKAAILAMAAVASTAPVSNEEGNVDANQWGDILKSFGIPQDWFKNRWSSWQTSGSKGPDQNSNQPGGWSSSWSWSSDWSKPNPSQGDSSWDQGDSSWDQDGFWKPDWNHPPQGDFENEWSGNPNPVFPGQPAPGTPTDKPTPGQPAPDQPAPGTPTDKPAPGGDFQKQILDAQNWYRSQHSVAPLEWDDEVAQSAKAWASQCTGTMLTHENQHKYGENIAWGSGMKSSGGVWANLWGNERTKYNFNTPGFTMGTGHFTQVVWKSTTKVGCAEVKCGQQTNVVCRYSPPGNMNDGASFRANVLPQTSGNPSDQYGDSSN